MAAWSVGFSNETTFDSGPQQFSVKNNFKIHLRLSGGKFWTESAHLGGTYVDADFKYQIGVNLKNVDIFQKKQLLIQDL